MYEVKKYDPSTGGPKWLTYQQQWAAYLYNSLANLGWKKKDVCNNGR